MIQNYLTPPGQGVYTVHTAGEKKEKLFQAYYHETDFEKVKSRWKESFKNIDSSVCLLGAPSDSGAGIVRGSNWGPLFLREKLLSENSKDYFDVGDIFVVPHLLHDKYLNLETIQKVRKALNLSESDPVSPLSMLEDFSKNFFKNYPKKNLLTLGGDHSISYPLTKSWIENFKSDEIGILHFDAHTDLLKERLGIDYCFGSWTYHASKLIDRPDKILQVGIRSSGKTKEHWEETIGVKQVWAHEVLERGSSTIGKEALDHFKKLGVKKLYLSFDIDVFDTQYASATGTPESGGITPKDAIEIMSAVCEEIEIHSADLVEVAPFIQYPEYKDLVNEPYHTLESAFSVLNFLLEYWNK